MSARDAFERWAELRWHPDAKGSLEQDASGGYYNTAVEYAWRAWQAAWLAAKADDAEICDKVAASPFQTMGSESDKRLRSDGATQCAYAIRASDAIGGR